jgi:hypothetical protein
MPKDTSSFQSVWRTLQGIETIHIDQHKGRVKWLAKGDAYDQAHFVASLFRIAFPPSPARKGTVSTLGTKRLKFYSKEHSERITVPDAIVISSTVLGSSRSPAGCKADVSEARVNPTKPGGLVPWLLIGFFAFALALQYLTGTYDAEFAGYPDEPAHFVSGLMVRDYIAEGFPTPPIDYVREYYRHYPKVAIGHWPPAFYLLEGAWMLVFGVSRTSVLILMAAITASAASLTAYTLCRAYGWRAATLAGGIVVAAPAVRPQTAMVMPEMLVAVCGFAAVVYFARYLDSLKWRDSAKFGLVASLCILTKGNGWAIVLVPPLALLLTGRQAILARRSFWVGAVVIAALCVPWHVFTAELVRHEWTLHSGESPYWLANFIAVMLSLPVLTGVPVFVLSIAGIAIMARQRSGTSYALYASMLALLLAVICFHTVVPLDVERRKLLLGVPALAFFAASSCAWLFHRIRARAVSSIAALLIPACMVLLHHKEIRPRERWGLEEAAELALRYSPKVGSTYLVSGSAAGEGAFIAEVSMRKRTHGERVILRGSKSLAYSDWDGGDYRPLLRETGSLKQFLDRQHVSVIVLENRSQATQREHQKLLAQLMQENPREWLPAGSGVHHQNRERGVQIFRRANISLSVFRTSELQLRV